MKLTKENLNEILTEMFRVVGGEYSEEVVKEEEWYLKYKWTHDQQNEFEKWLINYIKKTCKVSKKLATKEAGWFIFNFGWGLDND